MSPQKNLSVSPLLDQMERNYWFPEEIRDKKIFYAVSFCFNVACEELQDYCDITLQRTGEPGEFGGARFRVAAENLMHSDMVEGGNRAVSDINEEAYSLRECE